MAESKIGPKQAQLQALKQQRMERNKTLIDKVTTKAKAKPGGKVVNIKAAKRGGRGR